MERILRIIVLALAAFIILKMSTFGWRSWGRAFVDKKEENSQLAERLKRRVYKLAREANISYNTVVKIESGESTNPTTLTMAGIARALDVSLDDLAKECSRGT